MFNFIFSKYFHYRTFDEKNQNKKQFQNREKIYHPEELNIHFLFQNLDKLEKSFKNTQCPTNFKDLKDEGKELKSKLYKCVNKEVSNLKEIRSSMVIDAKGLKAIQALEEGIEKCKSEVHSFSSAVNGFWCLTPVILNFHRIIQSLIKIFT